MQVQELGHIVIGVRDLERAARFYRDVLGLRQVAMLGSDGVMLAGGAGRTHHELLLRQVKQVPDTAPAGDLGLRHFAWKIGTTDAELKAALDELRQAEVTIDHVTNHGDVTHSVYLKDPDGNTVEVYIDVQPELWRSDPSKAVGQGTAPLAL